MNTQTSASSVSGPPFSEHRVPREEGCIYVRDYGGEGPPFVVMHGFPDNLHIYDDLVPFLVAGGRRVVSFDFLGFGDSDKPAAGRYNFAQQVGDLHAVVTALGLGKVVPVAHDSSGPAALNYALDHSEHVASVVVLNALYSDSPTVRYPEFIELFATPSLKALTHALLTSPDQFAFILQFQRAAFQEMLSDEHKERYASFLGPIIDENFRRKPSSAPAFAQMTAGLFTEAARNVGRLSELEKLDIPVQLIWGERDPYLNVGVAEHIKSHLKRVSLDLLDAGHWIQIDLAEDVARLMLEGPRA